MRSAILVADGVPTVLHVTSDVAAKQTELGSNVYSGPVSPVSLPSLLPLPLEGSQRAREWRHTPLQTFWSCEILLLK